MGAAKIPEEELRKELEAGLTVKEIAKKHGMSIHGVYKRASRSRIKINESKMEGELAEDCFAHDRFNGRCACLSVKKCPGKSCPFYKEADKALEEARRDVDPRGVYRKNTLEVIAMIERNQGIGV